MNAERILQLADTVEVASVLPYDPGPCRVPRTEGLPDYFYMPVIWAEYGCGTAGCIAGFARGIFGGEAAQEALGLDDRTAEELFTPENYNSEELQATRFHPRNAARVLRRLAATGRVEWVA